MLHNINLSLAYKKLLPNTRSIGTLNNENVTK